MTRRQKRLSVIAGAALFLGTATALAVFALGQKASYFYMPADLAGATLASGQRIRLGGLVEKGTIERGAGTEIRFAVTDMESSVKVTFNGKAPPFLSAVKSATGLAGGPSILSGQATVEVS